VDPGSATRVFTAALAALVEEIKRDRSIVAAVLCGSLSHATVWEKSDIDLVLVTIDDRLVPAGDKSLYSGGVNIHAMLMPRAEFRRLAEGAARNSFVHSLLAKGRLLYTHDPTIEDLCASLQAIGERDTERQLLGAATHALPALYKARKWLVTLGDLEYTALWILYAATPLARVEVVGRRILAGREVLLQALALNPALFTTIYTDLLEGGTKKAVVERALKAAEAYMEKRAPRAFAPVLAYFKETGDVRSTRDVEDHFKKNFGVSHVTTACEYLADLGLLGKASTPVLLTKKSNTSLEELAFYATDEHGSGHHG
jgi:uncharacterized protein